MKILFVHQNFPGQYVHLARHLAASAENEVVCITQRTEAGLPGVRKLVYRPRRGVTPHIHPYLRDSEAAVLNAQAVARVALDLKRSGFMPDVMVGHNGWGEIWYLKDVFPRVPLLGYFEFFYQAHGADVGFDPSESVRFDTAPRLRTRNAGNLLGLNAADCGQCPTQWQRSTYPALYQAKLSVVHEGIDTRIVVPRPDARLKVPGTSMVLSAADEVVTYVARNLEPYRGFPSFMRSLPAILAARPKADVLIVGGDEVSYGTRLPAGQTYRRQLLDELDGSLDLRRVHFLGKVPYAIFLKILQISRAHVYLTYPFVLSWSMLEAMAAGCLVIASDTAPVREVIRDGENGLLVDFFDPRAIAGRVIETLSNPEAFTTIRERARQTIVDRYDLRTVALPAMLRLIERVGERR
ncbi:MAG: glycosyltransferase family 4 protein [Propionivibrio sp.]